MFSGISFDERHVSVLLASATTSLQSEDQPDLDYVEGVLDRTNFVVAC